MDRGRSDLVRRISRHYPGGFVGIRDALGLPPLAQRGQPLPAKAARLEADLAELIEALGDHIHNLPRKVWLQILRQAKALDAIGPRSALQPIKVALLSGEITPEQLKPQPGNDGELQPSVLSKRLQALVDAAKAQGSDTDDDDEDEEGGATAASPLGLEPAVDVDVDVADDDDLQRARLVNLHPAARLDAVSAAGRAASDEAVLASIAQTAIEQQWAQILAAADAAVVVGQLREAAAGDRWAELVRSSVLDEWQAIEQLGELEGLELPDGMQLNLMQKREAVLLQRDRRRLNISAPGAGKTLSAIAGAAACGCERVLVFSPNAAILTWAEQLSQFTPRTALASKTWAPEWQDDDSPRWLLLNHEMLSAPGLAPADAVALVERFQPDLVVVDEIHLAKDRGAGTESRRHRNLLAITTAAANRGAFVYGMSGTPLVNELSEVRSLLRLVGSKAAEEIDTRLSVDNCLSYHEALLRVSTRYVPRPAAELIEHQIHVRADHLVEDAIAASQRGHTAVDAALAPAKFEALVAEAQRPGKLLVFTSAIDGVVLPAIHALSRAGIRAVMHTGEIKQDSYGRSSVSAFMHDPEVKVLVASTSTLATGFDGLQRICSRVLFLTSPWTAVEREQAIARVLRPGQLAAAVEVGTVVASLADPDSDSGDDWSLDEQRLERITSKRSAAAAVCDGVIPEAAALTWSEASVRRALRSWGQRVQARQHGHGQEAGR